MRIPYVWLLAFFLVPFLIVLKISLSQTAIAQPPYTPVFDLAAGWHGIASFFAGLSFDNYVLLGSDPLYLLSYVKSVEIAAFSTLMLLVIGYPIAYAIARTPRALAGGAGAARHPAVLDLAAHPHLCLDEHPAARRSAQPASCWRFDLCASRRSGSSTDTAIYIGIVYSYLPFMVLPLYATLEKLDESLLEAAADLGCPRWKTFWLVTLPLSSSGRGRRRAAVLHPDRRRVRHSRSARRLAIADDRADHLDGIFRQQGLAGRRPRSPSCWFACWSRRS